MVQEENKLTLEQIEEAVTSVSRKYGWNALEIEPGVFQLTIGDGEAEARELVDSLDDIEALVRRLEGEVDEHEYPTIGQR